MNEQRLYDALKRITRYLPPDQLRRRSQKLYGLDGSEAIEFAYENALQEAKDAIKGMRRPVVKVKPAGIVPGNGGGIGQGGQ